MQSNPRILVNLLVKLNILANLLVKLTKIRSGGAIGAGEYTRERLVRLGDLAEGQGPLGGQAQEDQARTGKARPP